MIREVNLTSYLPIFIQEYRELNKLLIAETPEVQKVEDETEIVKNNQFILTCDEVGISKYEQMLNIVPSADDSLEARKSKVLIKWNDTLPYTLRKFNDKMKEICGEGNYLIVPKFNIYELELYVSLFANGSIAVVENLIDYMMPANIKVKIMNDITHDLVGKVYLGNATVETSHFVVG